MTRIWRNPTTKQVLGQPTQIDSWVEIPIPDEYVLPDYLQELVDLADPTQYSVILNNGSGPAYFSLGDTLKIDSGNLESKIRGGALAVAGTAKVMAATDIFTTIVPNSGSAVSITIPITGTGAGEEPWRVGDKFRVMQGGAGQVTISEVAASGVVVNGYPTAKTAGQYAVIECEMLFVDSWVVSGATAAS